MGQAIKCSLKAHFNCSFKCALKSYPKKKKCTKGLIDNYIMD